MGALCGRDVTGSLRHLYTWTTHVVDSGAVEMLSERVDEIRDHLSKEATGILSDVLVLYANNEGSESESEEGNESQEGSESEDGSDSEEGRATIV